MTRFSIEIESGTDAEIHSKLVKFLLETPVPHIRIDGKFNCNLDLITKIIKSWAMYRRAIDYFILGWTPSVADKGHLIDDLLKHAWEGDYELKLAGLDGDNVHLARGNGSQLKVTFPDKEEGEEIQLRKIDG